MGSQELIDEIKQITSQYQAEVGSENKPWPRSIRDRVVALIEHGIPATKISKATGIPYFTVLKWRRGKAGLPGRSSRGFKEVAVVDKVDAVAAATKVDTQKIVATTTTQKLAIALGGQVQRPDVPVPITTPDGFKIELPCVDAAIDFIIKLRRIGA